MNYRHLLVPVHAGSAVRAIDAARDLAMQHGAAITLMYVIEAIADSAVESEGEFDSLYAAAEAHVRDRLQQLSRPLAEAGISVRPEIVVGERARTIVQYSAGHSVDLIVMESDRCDLTHPEQALDHFSHQVSIFCQCPVMLLK